MPQRLPGNIALALHLSSGLDTADGIRLTSGLRSGLKDARKITERNPETGAKIPDGHYGSWLGAIGYMVLLDQIGACFKPKSAQSRNNEENDFKKALFYFSKLNPNAIDALYALRCAFTHDYSLYNIPKSKSKKSVPPYTHRYRHHFVVGQGANLPVVILPKEPWDGNRDNRSSNNQTSVNLEAFGDMVEEICTHIISLHQTNGLEVVLEGGLDELQDRYGIAFRP